MTQSRRALLDELLDLMSEPDDDLARATAIAICNRAVETIWLKKEWTDHRMPTPYEFSTVVNQRTYVLPDYFGRVAGFDPYIRNLTTGKRIAPSSVDEIEATNPTAGTTLENAGPPEVYAIAGTQGVHTQPASTGEALEVVSDDATDTSSYVVVEGLSATGIWQRRRAQLMGTTPVAIGTFSQVINFSKGQDDTTTVTGALTSAGNVTLRITASATELEVLANDEAAHERLTLVLYPKADAVYTIAVPVIRSAVRLDSDADEVPRYWGPAIIEEAMLNFAFNQGSIPLAQLIAAPRPRLNDLIQHDNSLLYRTMKTRPFTL